MPLPVNVDSTYADSGTDASVALHQQHHDIVHGAVNALAGGTTGQVLGKTSSADFATSWVDPAGGSETATTISSSGSAQTLTLPSATRTGTWDITLTAAACALTLAGAAAGTASRMTLILRQDATGGRTVTWPASVRWPGGVSSPTLTAIGSRADIVTLVSTDGGTKWFGQVVGTNYPTLTAVASDAFTRADGTLAGSAAPTGQTWSVLSGSYSVSSNHVVAGSTDSLAVLDSSLSDCTVQADITMSGESGLAFRTVDSTNGWRWVKISTTQSVVQKRVGSSSWTTVATLTGAFTDNVTSAWAVSLSGSSMTFTLNGTTVGTATDSALQTATKHGFAVGLKTAPQWDNFSVA